MASIRIRWMVGGDILMVSRLEAKFSSDPFSQTDLKQLLFKEAIEAVVAEVNGTIVGYLLAYRKKRHLKVLTWLVAPDFRRRGIGRHLFVFLLQGPSSPTGVRSVVCPVRETADGYHKFLVHLGFKAIRLIRDYYREPQEDAYLFSWWLPDAHLLERPSDASASVQSK